MYFGAAATPLTFDQQMRLNSQTNSQQLATQSLTQQAQAQQAYQDTARIQATSYASGIQNMASNTAALASSIAAGRNLSVPIFQADTGSSAGLVIGISIGVLVLAGGIVFLLRPRY